MELNKCTAMTKATIGDGVTTLGNRAFYGCTSLKSATLGSNLRTINYRAFYNCKALEAIVIPDGVVTFGVVTDYSGSNDYNKSETFVGCTSLKSVTIGKKVTNMGTGVFMNCTALKDLTIKNGCKTIGGKCFDGCNAITTIKNYCVDIPTTASNAFSSYTANLYVPSSAIDDYKAADPWKKFGQIDVMENAPSDGDNKVATPTIAYDCGKILFASATDGAEFVSEVRVDDAQKSNSAEITLTQLYVITVYATATGMDNSDVATARIGWRNGKPVMEGFDSVVLDEDGTRGDVNEDGTVDVADIATIISIMAANARMMEEEEE